MESNNRRKFLQNSGLVLGGISVFPQILISGKSGLRTSASDNINFGLIGCKGMGWSNMSTILNNVTGSRCIALCDVDQSVLDQRS